jgi:hypothetical protein
MRLTERIKKRRADFWAALGDNGNNGIEELLKLYWWWGSDTADFFFDKFVPAGLSLENLEAEKKNAIGTMLTAVREDISQLAPQRTGEGSQGRRQSHQRPEERPWGNRQPHLRASAKKQYAR